MVQIKESFLSYYKANETKVGLAFFLGGFIFDILTLSDIDNLFSIAQQITYLLITGSILYYEFLVPLGAAHIHPRLEKIWNYRKLIFHFILGSILSLYSLFFIKSASVFSSLIFVLIIMGLMVANEFKAVQDSGLNIKLSLYMICIFSFFCMLFPVILGFVGWVPFLLALGMSCLFLWAVYQLLLRKIQDQHVLVRKLITPSASVIFLFLVFYMIGWIPPVPLSVQNMGIYHKIEKKDSKFILYHEKPSWRFWHNGDQDFVAQNGDQIYFFARIFSPARFSDSVILHWSYKDPRKGWVSTDSIPMQISGGRQDGYRGFAVKQNYTAGEWKVSVQTTDNREIGRMYFNVTKTDSTNERVFEQQVF